MNVSLIKRHSYKRSLLRLVPGSSHICFGELSSSAQQLHQLPARPGKPLPPTTRPAPPVGLAVRSTIHFKTQSTLKHWPLSHNLSYPSAVDMIYDLALNPEEHGAVWRVSVMLMFAARVTYYNKRHYCENNWKRGRWHMFSIIRSEKL